MIFCYSISHETTPLAIREQLSLTPDQQQTWLSGLRDVEAIVLSTCNRLEFYAHICKTGMDQLWADLLAMRGIDAELVAPYTNQLSNYEAAHHLYQVACGLKSMALGEPQILGQITNAYEQGNHCHTVGHALSMLFRGAIHTAKRVHTTTMISGGSTSVSALGIQRASEVCGDLTSKSILVIGAGEMAQTVIKGLSHRGANNVTLLSRTYERAQSLAEHWNISAKPITYLKEGMAAADVIFTTSSAPFTILNVHDVAPIMETRPERPLCIIDVAVPRDVEPEVGQIRGVSLHDIDDLAHVVAENLAERESAIPHANQIINEELAQFWTNYRGLDIAPTIRQLREQVDEIRQSELERMLNRLGTDDERLIALLDEFSTRLMNKILHPPTQNLRLKAAQGDSALLTTLARDLFGLEEAS